MKNILQQIEKLLKDGEFAIFVEGDKKHAYNATTHLLAPMTEDGKPNIANSYSGNFYSAMLSFAPEKTLDFKSGQEVDDFNKTMNNFIFLKNVRIYSEDQRSVTIEVIQDLHPRMNKKDGSVLTTIKADTLEEALAQLSAFMQKHIAKEQADIEKRNKIYE